MCEGVKVWGCRGVKVWMCKCADLPPPSWEHAACSFSYGRVLAKFKEFRALGRVKLPLILNCWSAELELIKLRRKLLAFLHGACAKINEDFNGSLFLLVVVLCQSIHHQDADGVHRRVKLICNMDDILSAGSFAPARVAFIQQTFNRHFKHR